MICLLKNLQQLSSYQDQCAYLKKALEQSEITPANIEQWVKQLAWTSEQYDQFEQSIISPLRSKLSKIPSVSSTSTEGCTLRAFQQCQQVLADNPLLKKRELPPLAEIRPEHIEPASRAELSRLEKELSRLETLTQPTWENLVAPFLDLQADFSQLYSQIIFVSGVNNSDALRTARQNTTESLERFSNKLFVSSSIYKGFRKVLSNTDLSASQKRTIEILLNEFEETGVHLSAQEKEQFDDLCVRLKAEKTKFNNNLLLKKPGECLDNTDPINQIVKLQYQTAKLLGYRSYAAYKLNNNLFSKGPEIKSIFKDLLQKLLQKLDQEKEVIDQFIENKGYDPEEFYDVLDRIDFLKKLRKQKAPYKGKELNAYFPLPHVLEQLLSFAGDMLGVQFRPIDDPPSAWHTDVKQYQVIDIQSKETKGYIAFDLYERPGTKRKGAWSFTITPRHKYQDTTRLEKKPVVCCAQNLVSPKEGEPALMTPQQVKTMLHEFGHAMGSILSEQDNTVTHGNSFQEDDAGEIESTFWEQWLNEPNVLKRFSCHYQTKEPLPDHWIEHFIKKQKQGAGVKRINYLALALTDLYLYDEYVPNEQQTPKRAFIDHMLDICPKDYYNVLSDVMRFRHIFSAKYAASYSCYGLADYVVANFMSAYEQAKDKGLEAAQKALGRKFRQEMLSCGAARPFRESIHAFLGHALKPEALYRQWGLEP